MVFFFTIFRSLLLHLLLLLLPSTSAPSAILLVAKRASARAFTIILIVCLRVVWCGYRTVFFMFDLREKAPLFSRVIYAGAGCRCFQMGVIDVCIICKQSTCCFLVTHTPNYTREIYACVCDGTLVGSTSKTATRT